MQQKRLREGELTESEVKHVLNKTENNKVPGNDGFTKEFFRTFWLKSKAHFSLHLSKNPF